MRNIIQTPPENLTPCEVIGIFLMENDIDFDVEEREGENVEERQIEWGDIKDSFSFIMAQSGYYVTDPVYIGDLPQPVQDWFADYSEKWPTSQQIESEISEVVSEPETEPKIKPAPKTSRSESDKPKNKPSKKSKK